MKSFMQSTQPLVALSPPHDVRHPHPPLNDLCEQEETVTASWKNMLPLPTFSNRPLYVYVGKRGEEMYQQ